MNVKCRHCQSEIIPKKKRQGSTGLGLVLWFVFIAITVVSLGTFFFLLLIPLLYDLWRIFSAKKYICPACGMVLSQ